MNVCGWHSKTRLPLRSALAIRASNFRSFVQSAFHRAASFSTSKKPALWRVFAYSAPGFPKPTMRCNDSMRGRGTAGPAPQKLFLLLSALASGLASAFLSPRGSGFRVALGRGFFAGLAGRRAPSAPSSFFSLVISTSPAAGAASAATTSSSARGAATATTVMCLSPKISTPCGRLDFADVNGLADFEAGHVHDNLFRQILRQAADLELEQNVFEHAAAGLHAGGFAGGFHRHLDGDFFVFGDFMKIHMQHLAVERMMLDFLHQREALGAGVVFDGQIHQQVFRDGMVDAGRRIPWS